MIAMKSKSFDLKESSAEKGKHSQSFDFIGLYKPAAETNVRLLDKQSSDTPASKTKPSTPKRENSPNKKKKKNEPLDISHITIDGRNLSQSGGRSSPANDSRVTSTPYSTAKILKQEPKVKSIMKNASANDADSMDDSSYDPACFKRKKRNKSVSFMLDDTEEVAMKKTKSNESVKIDKKEKMKGKNVKDESKKKDKKLKKNQNAEKENKVGVNMDTDYVDSTDNSKTKGKNPKNLLTDATVDSEEQNQVSQGKKKKLKKLKKQKKGEGSPDQEENETNNNDDTSENKSKKLKKKKRKSKSPQPAEMDGVPAIKSRKKEEKPDIIAEDLENLSIGDNAHTLTNLLDEMTVVDKDRKKNKLKKKKKVSKNVSMSSTEAVDLEKIDEGKEKIKWQKRKWNKDKKGTVDQEEQETCVIIGNLPIKLMTNYKKLLADHFGKLGLIKKIGIAEVYPTEEPKPVFTTTINFYSEGAATKALEEDNTSLEGSRIRVNRLLPPTETTMVVRTYADLSEQALSSVFIQAGRIRSIRLLVKGKKAIGTAFIEFDGPEAVERAIKMAADAKIGGKKIYVSKFEQRQGKKKKVDKPKSMDSENEGDSEDSND